MPLDVKWPFTAENTICRSWSRRSTAVITAISLFSKIVSQWTNRVTVHNVELLHKLVETREPGRSLLTVSNHQSCVDDPLLWGVLHFKIIFGKETLLRWTPAASDISFTNELHSRFFSLGQVVPVERGGGVYQRGINFVLDKLNNGGWVHMFPEGGVNMTKEDKRLKWGVGRLIAECKHMPIVLPLWHIGMDSILPNKPPYIPRVGKRATVLVGEPIDFRELLQYLKTNKKSPMEMRKAITDVIQDEFLLLREKAESLHYNRTFTHS